MTMGTIGIAIAGAAAGSLVSSALAPSASSVTGGATGAAASAADPFASQRGQYQKMLSDMMTGAATPATAATEGHWSNSGGGGGQLDPSGSTMNPFGWAVPNSTLNAAGVRQGAGGSPVWVAGTPATAGSSGGFTPQDPSYNWRFQQGLVGLERSNAAAGMTGSGAEMAAASAYGQNMASTEYANQFSRLSQLAGANVGSPAAAGQIIQGAANQQQAGATAFGSQIGGAVQKGVGALFSSSGDATGFNTGVGGAGASGLTAGSDQSQMLNQQWTV